MSSGMIGKLPKYGVRDNSYTEVCKDNANIGIVPDYNVMEILFFSNYTISCNPQ